MIHLHTINKYISINIIYIYSVNISAITNLFTYRTWKKPNLPERPTHRHFLKDQDPLRGDPWAALASPTSVLSTI